MLRYLWWTKTPVWFVSLDIVDSLMFDCWTWTCELDHAYRLSLSMLLPCPSWVLCTSLSTCDSPTSHPTPRCSSSLPCWIAGSPLNYNVCLDEFNTQVSDFCTWSNWPVSLTLCTLYGLTLEINATASSKICSWCPRTQTVGVEKWVVLDGNAISRRSYTLNSLHYRWTDLIEKNCILTRRTHGAKFKIR